MKKYLFLFIAGAFLSAACIDLDGDEILPVDESTVGGIVVTSVDESSFESSVVAAATAASTSYNFGDSDTSDDNIAATTFDRVIRIVFGGKRRLPAMRMAS